MLLWIALVVILAGLALAVWAKRRLNEPPGSPPLVRINGNRFAAAQLLRTQPAKLLEDARKQVWNLSTLFFL
jgi:hypothetical protein